MVQTALADCGAEAARSVVIGDTGWDMGMARAGGAYAIGVLWGYHDADELTAAGAHVLASHPAEVLTLAEDLVEQGA
jgi:phosphoglycolate phosphatase